MSGLGDLLELLHDAHSRETTLDVQLRDWNEVPRRSAIVADGPGVDGRPRLQWRGPRPRSTHAESRRRIWVHGPNRLRVEIRGHGVLRVLAIRDGTRWWWWDGANGASTGEEVGSEMPAALSPPMLSPAQLVGSLCFELAGDGTRAGRHVVRARARPRREGYLPVALTYELEFDAEHGTMLRLARFEDEVCVQTTEVVDVRYGGEVDPRQFIFLSPGNRAPRPAVSTRSGS